MKTGTTIALTLVAAGLLVYIVQVERKTLSSEELALRQGRLLPGFVRQKVSRIELARGGTTVVLERSGDPADPAARWVLTAPRKEPADAETMEALLSAVEFAEARRTLAGISEGDRATFGLAQPRVTARFTVLGSVVSLTVGGEDAKGQGAYASTDDPGVAHVVGKDLVEALDVDADQFRDREVLRGADAESATRIAVSEGGRTVFELEQRGSDWWTKRPFEGYAAARYVNQALAAVATFRASRHVADAAAGGPVDGARVVTLTSPKGAFTFTVGGPCPGHAEERLLRVGDGPAVCAPEKDLQTITLDPELLREDRLVRVEEGEVDRIDVRRGDAKVSAYREQGVWKVEGGGAVAAADPEAVAAYVRALRVPRAVEYVALPGGAPLAELTLTRRGGAVETLRLREDVAGVALVERVPEKTGARFALDAEALFPAHVIAFRSRRLLEERSIEAAKVVREAAGVREQAERRDAVWYVAGADERKTAGGSVAAVVETFSNLTAERFVAPAPEPSHGLDRPELTLEVTYDPAVREQASMFGSTTEGAGKQDPADKESAADVPGPAAAGKKAPAARPKPAPKRVHVLRVGAAVGDGSRYAQVGEGPVFALPEAIVERLKKAWRIETLRAPEANPLEEKLVPPTLPGAKPDASGSEPDGRGVHRVRRRRR